MITINLRHADSSLPTVNPADRFAIARNGIFEWWNLPEYSDWLNAPLSGKQCDNGNTISRGRNIPISNDCWDFVYQINDEAGIRFAESVGRLIINRPYFNRYGIYHGPDTGTATDDPINADPQAMAEPICYPVNPYKIIGETATHYQVDAYYYGMNWKTLDIKVDNWLLKPWKIVKMCAETRGGSIQNVMAGIDAFWLTLSARTGAWIPKELLVLPPDPTQYVINGNRGIGYRLYGANWIMGLEDGSQVNVRKVTKAAGIQEFHGWHINARSVIPPEWFK